VSTLAAPPRLPQLPLVPQGGSSNERLRRSDGGRLTLEQRLDRVWEGLLAAGAAECPLCGGDMERSGAAGRCGDCGSTIS
jgi:tRNA(Ile2) C34 agmatinyltransferase TiaS